MRLKRQILILTMAAAVCGCGKGAEKTELPPQTEVTAAETAGKEETVQTEKEEESTEESREPMESREPEGDAASEENYEDNFDVDGAAAAAFGKKVKEAVAERNREQMAELAAFPLYLGLPDGGRTVETKEEFLELETETVFTRELMDSVAAADENSLTPSMAGFVLADENGAPNVVFGVRDGKLAVNGINY